MVAWLRRVINAEYIVKTFQTWSDCMMPVAKQSSRASYLTAESSLCWSALWHTNANNTLCSMRHNYVSVRLAAS